MQLNSRTSTPAQSGVRIPIGSVPAAHPLIPDISIQHLRNIDPEMDRARDEALKTAEADRARFRREQRRKWICGDVLAYPELAGSSVLQGLRACAPFCALSCIQVQLEDDTAAASPSPSTSTGADHPPASDPRPVPTHRPLFGLKRDLAVLLELELDARKWYGTAAAPYFEELGCRLEQHLRGLGGGGGGGAPGPLDTQNHGQRSAGRPNGAGCDAGGAGLAAATAAASALLAEAQEVCNRPGGRSMRGLARCNGVSAAQRHCMLTCPRRWHVAAAEAGVHQHGGAHPFRMTGGGVEDLAAAEGVTDEHRLLAVVVEAGGHGAPVHLLSEAFEGIGLAPVRGAHPGQGDRRDPEIQGQEGGDKAPPVCVGAVAVHQDQAGLAPLAPGEQFDVGAVDRDHGAFRLLGDGGGEPGGRRRRRAMEGRQGRFDLRPLGGRGDGHGRSQTLVRYPD